MECINFITRHFGKHNGIPTRVNALVIQQEDLGSHYWFPSLLNSNLPNFQAKLIPIDLKGTLRRLLVTKPGPKSSVCWLMYLLKKLFAVRAILAFLFQNCFLTARLYDVKEG